MTNVLVLFAATPDPAAALRSAFGDSPLPQQFPGATGAPATIDVVTWSAPATEIGGVRQLVVLGDLPHATLDRVFERIGVRALRDRLAGFPAGRLINSMGAADAARTFWRSFRSAHAASALAGADVIVVAGDLPATRAAAKLLRQGRAARALWGVRAAADLLVRERGER